VEIKHVILLRYPHGVDKYNGREAIERARSRLREREYCLFRNNCEHLINWAITDKKESDQIATVAKGAVVTAAGFAILGGTVAAAAFAYFLASGDGKKRKEKNEDNYDD
jgi:hypothetical protein